MSPELAALAAAALLQGAQYVAVSLPANRELGPAVTLAPRDDGPLVDRVGRGTARLARALDNHFEALTLFTIAVVVVALGPGTTALTAVLAWVYVAARLLYVPAYYYGWAPGRSLIWMAGFGATMAMLAAALIVTFLPIAPG